MSFLQPPVNFSWSRYLSFYKKVYLCKGFTYNVEEFAMTTLILGLLIPLLGTMLGSAFVFFMKGEMPERLQKSLLGFASLLTPVLPYMLAFAAGAMFYVVVEELIPEASEGKHSNLSTIGFAVGFVLMMVLDVVMG